MIEALKFIFSPKKRVDEVLSKNDNELMKSTIFTLTYLISLTVLLDIVFKIVGGTKVGITISLSSVLTNVLIISLTILFSVFIFGIIQKFVFKYFGVEISLMKSLFLSTSYVVMIRIPELLIIALTIITIIFTNFGFNLLFILSLIGIIGKILNFGFFIYGIYLSYIVYKKLFDGGIVKFIIIILICSLLSSLIVLGIGRLL